MHRAVLPKPSKYEEWLLAGNDDRSTAVAGREEVIEEEESAGEDLAANLGQADTEKGVGGTSFY